MALLTQRGMEKLLRRIWETGGLTPDMEEDISRLKAEFDEREGLLRRYGETYDGEDYDEDEYEFQAREEDPRDWKSEYETMRQRYVDRFFGGRDRDREDRAGDDFKEDLEEIYEEQETDVKRDGEKQTFNELLERTEG